MCVHSHACAFFRNYIVKVAELWKEEREGMCKRHIQWLGKEQKQLYENKLYPMYTDGFQQNCDYSRNRSDIFHSIWTIRCIVEVTNIIFLLYLSTPDEIVDSYTSNLTLLKYVIYYLITQGDFKFNNNC